MPHLTPEFWAHCFDGVMLTVIMWIGRAIWWAIKKGNEEMVGMVDARARLAADVVRIETRAQFDKIEIAMADHEIKDQKRHDEVMSLIQKTQTA